jgi:type II secretory pathway pseudopilin PulG
MAVCHILAAFLVLLPIVIQAASLTELKMALRAVLRDQDESSEDNFNPSAWDTNSKFKAATSAAEGAARRDLLWAKETRSQSQARNPNTVLSHGKTLREVYDHQSQAKAAYDKKTSERRALYTATANSKEIQGILDYVPGKYANVEFYQVAKDGGFKLAGRFDELDETATDDRTPTITPEADSLYLIRGCDDTSKHDASYTFSDYNCEVFMCFSTDPSASENEGSGWAFCNNISEELCLDKWAEACPNP